MQRKTDVTDVSREITCRLVLLQTIPNRLLLSENTRTHELPNMPARAYVCHKLCRCSYITTMLEDGFFNVSIFYLIFWPDPIARLDLEQMI